jgi:hypothetical protein
MLKAGQVLMQQVMESPPNRRFLTRPRVLEILAIPLLVGSNIKHKEAPGI